MGNPANLYNVEESNTILSTIPNFFVNYLDAMMAVQGSDSKPEYLEKCRLTCKKKCIEGRCRSSHRRINIYQSYVDKNYDTFELEYQFYGGKRNTDTHIVIEDYAKGKKYDSVLLLRKES
jgi:hypothetical protein